MTSDYVYNFNDGALESSFRSLSTSRIGDGSGDPEQAYFDMLQLLIEIKRNGQMLDVGAGQGRALSIGKDRISRIVALEPDIERFSFCHKTYNSSPKCDVFNLTFEQYLEQSQKERFDLICVGMVIPHMATDATAALLKGVASLLTQTGLAIVATTLRPDSAPQFTTSGGHGARMTKEAFDDYAHFRVPTDKGIPVRKFTRNELEEEVSPWFEILYWSQYSYLLPKGVKYFSNELKVPPEDLQDLGFSQFAILRAR